ncbi:O-antigen ligase family protein [Thermodesulfobacteriota bacterium]
MTKTLSSITRCAIYTLLIFTPLARGSVQGWAVTAIHMITLIALTAFLLEKNLSGNWKWIKTPLDKPIICLLLLCLLSTLFSEHRRTSFWSFILLLNYLTLFYLVIHTFRSRSRIRQLAYVIIGIAVFLSVFGMIKQSGANPFPWWDYTDINLNPDLAAASSTYGNPNHYAGFLVMAIPLALGLLTIGIRGASFFLMFSLALILLSALILSGSRGGWGSAFVGMVVIGTIVLTSPPYRQTKYFYLLFAGMTILLLVALSSTSVVLDLRSFGSLEGDPSLLSRASVWKNTFKMITDYPLLGSGPGTFALIFTQYQPVGTGLPVRYYYAHNDYLQFTAEVGLLLSVIIGWIIFSFFKTGFRKLKNHSRLINGITIGGLGAISAILVFSIVDFNLHIPANALLFTVIAAIVVTPMSTENARNR